MLTDMPQTNGNGFALTILDQVNHAVRPFNLGKIELSLEGIPPCWSFVLYIERFGGRRFDLKMVDELAFSHPQAYYEAVSRAFGEAVGEYYRSFDVPIDDHIVLGED